MTNNVNSLSKEDIQKATTWINKYFRNSLTGSLKNCEVCNNNHWTLQDQLFTPIPWDGKTVNFSLALPQILIFCNTCGNMKAFSAIKIGVCEQKHSEKQENE